MIVRITTPPWLCRHERRRDSMATDFQSRSCSYTDVCDVHAELARPATRTSCPLVADNDDNDGGDIARTSHVGQLSRVIDVAYARCCLAASCLRQFQFLVFGQFVVRLFLYLKTTDDGDSGYLYLRGWRWRAAVAVLKTGEWHSATAGRKGVACGPITARSLSINNRPRSKYWSPLSQWRHSENCAMAEVAVTKLIAFFRLILSLLLYRK